MTANKRIEADLPKQTSPARSAAQVDAGPQFVSTSSAPSCLSGAAAPLSR